MRTKQCTREEAETANARFEKDMRKFLKKWAKNHRGEALLRFNRPFDDYLAEDVLRDFFLTSEHPLQQLLKKRSIFGHLSRPFKRVYFDQVSGDPLFSSTEQRIYNLARRMSSEDMHVPFRSIHPIKQTECGDIADVSTYPVESEEIRYNSGNHFVSRPANSNVFEENSKRIGKRATDKVKVFFKRGFLEDRLQEIKDIMKNLDQTENAEELIFVICSRHSPKEGHYGVSVVLMETSCPEFPKRVMVCDTLLKDLPQHPRWWPFFVEEFSNVFGPAVTELIEDISHPLQKVNIKGDDPYRHDWDCPYYAAAMADALVSIALCTPWTILNGAASDVHKAMKKVMPEYYEPNEQIRERSAIREANKIKRWKSGRTLIKNLASQAKRRISSEHFS